MIQIKPKRLHRPRNSLYRQATENDRSVEAEHREILRAHLARAPKKSAHSRKCLRRCPIWLDNLISGFGDHILKFETDAAIVWGALLSHEKKDPHPIDKQIAAIALIYNLVLVTRDKGYAFAKIPNLRVINPFN